MKVKGKIFLVTDRLEIIQGVKKIIQESHIVNDIDFQTFSTLAWTENLENPFLRSRLLDRPNLLSGTSPSDSFLAQHIQPEYFENEKLSESKEEYVVPEMDMNNVVNFPKFPSSVVSMSDIERAAILQAIQGCEGNISLAAKKLGLGRATLYRKLKEHSIDQKFLKAKFKSKKVA